MQESEFLTKKDLESDYGIKRSEIKLLQALGLKSMRVELGTLFPRRDVDQFMLDQPELRTYLEERLSNPKKTGRPKKSQ